MDRCVGAAALLAAEMEERESQAITRLLHEARLPRMKTLEAFEFDRSGVSAAHLRTLAERDYVSRAEPVLLVGEAATGKTHPAAWFRIGCLRWSPEFGFPALCVVVSRRGWSAWQPQVPPSGNDEAKDRAFFHRGASRTVGLQDSQRRLPRKPERVNDFETADVSI